MRLKRSLTLWNLIIIGIVIIQPIAPMGIYGVINNEARGHVVTTILIAMVAMLFTAISYGKMARAYPSAGSAYTYVGREIHPALGYVTGWAMVMDYILNPLICTIICSKLAQNILPGVPYWVMAVAFAGVFTALNLRAVQYVGANQRSVRGGNDDRGGDLFRVCDPLPLGPARIRSRILRPAVLRSAHIQLPGRFPRHFDCRAHLHRLRRHFDFFRGGREPAAKYSAGDGAGLRDHGSAIVTRSLCRAAGVGRKTVSAGHGGIGFSAGGRQAGGFFLFHLLNFTILIANVGSGMGAQLAAARLLYGMGRSDALPRGFFGAIEPRRRIPMNNVLLIGAIALTGAFLVSYERGVELLNFGAFIAFMGVNAAAFVRYFWRAADKRWTNFAFPLLGFAICFFIWLNLSRPAKIAGGIWIMVGIIYGAVKTRGFQASLVRFDMPADET